MEEIGSLLRELEDGEAFTLFAPSWDAYEKWHKEHLGHRGKAVASDMEVVSQSTLQL